MTDFLNFDINEAANAATPEREALPLIPDNTVAAATVVKTELRTTHEGKGARLDVTYEILEGPFSTFPGGKGGRKIFDSYCLAHPDSDSAVTFGRKDLARLVQALRFTTMPNPISQVENKPLTITVGIDKERTDKRTGKTYAARNKVKEWNAYSSGGNAPTRQAPPRPPAGPTPTVVEQNERSDGGQTMDDIPF